jgi:hypothetical protein
MSCSGKNLVVASLVGGVAIAAAAIVAPHHAFAGVGGGDVGLCKISQGQINMVQSGRVDQALKVGASRNTDAGRGNGGELAIAGIICVDNIPIDDKEFNIDANDFGGIIATDPGNSNQ